MMKVMTINHDSLVRAEMHVDRFHANQNALSLEN
jgi:hypothetical protein